MINNTCYNDADESLVISDLDSVHLDQCNRNGSIRWLQFNAMEMNEFIDNVSPYNLIHINYKYVFICILIVERF